MPEFALDAVAEMAGEELFFTVEWFEPFELDHSSLRQRVIPDLIPKSHLEKGCGSNATSHPLSPREPKAALLVGPAPRCGVASLIASRDERNELIGLWPFITDGVQLKARIDKLLLAPDRLQAAIEATLDGGLALSWFDMFFAADRGFYAQGAVHDFVVSGIAHDFKVGSQPDVFIHPTSPTFDVLREAQPESVGEDGAIRIKMAGMAAILPASVPGWYSICGPVTRINKYPLRVLERDVWELRVVVARDFAEDDRELELAAFVTDLVLAGARLPEIGEDISALVRLQGRIWMPDTGPIDE